MTLQVYPVLIPYDSNAHISESDFKIFVGIWIFMNIASLISWTITGIKWALYKLRRNKSSNWWWGRWEYEFLMIWDVVMIVLWIVILLVWGGIFISKFL